MALRLGPIHHSDSQKANGIHTKTPVVFCKTKFLLGFITLAILWVQATYLHTTIIQLQVNTPDPLDTHLTNKVVLRNLSAGKHTVLQPRVAKETEETLILAELKDLGVGEYTVYRNHADNASKGSNGESMRLPVVMVVHHREFFLGCHTFERFFNPKWETIFILEDYMVEMFNLKELARESDSPAVHFATLIPTVRSGEWLGHAVALKIMKHAPIDASLLFNAQCDVHPLPEFHQKHISFDQAVTRMVTEFLREDELGRRQHGMTNVNDYKHMFRNTSAPEYVCKRVFDVVDRPLLVMNTILLETLPSADTLEGSKFHAYQVGLSRNWKKQFERPKDLSPDEPWMSDVSTFFENHLSMFNATLLDQIMHRFLPVGNTIGLAVATLPSIMCEHGWKAVRLNDMQFLFDFAQIQHKSISSTGDEHALLDVSKYNHSSSSFSERLRMESLSYFADFSGNAGCLQEYMRLRVFGNFNVHHACTLVHNHLQRNHIPANFWLEPVHKNEDMVAVLLNMWGFVYIKSTAENKLLFLSVETLPTPSSAPFLDRLRKENTTVDGSLARMNSIHLITDREERLSWKLLEIDRNSKLEPNGFFRDFRTKFIWNREAFYTYGTTARILCDWILSYDHRLEFDDDDDKFIGLVSGKEILLVLSRFKSVCPLTYIW